MNIYGRYRYMQAWLTQLIPLNPSRNTFARLPRLFATRLQSRRKYPWDTRKPFTDPHNLLLQ